MATILIVDDRADNRQSLAALVSGKGHRVIEADDGAQALALARARPPDLVITDGLMPVMDGFEMLRRLRSDPHLAHTRVIFYTAAYPDAEARSLAHVHGVQSCVRAEDTVCRYGGEEFVILLVRASLDGIVVAAERMRSGVIMLSVPGFRQPVSAPTLSIGTAVWPEHGRDGDALIRAADAALYRAKRAGRNRVEVAGPEGA